MSPFENALHKIDAFLELIKTQKGVEFPYPHSKKCLEEIEILFSKQKDALVLINSIASPLPMGPLTLYGHVLARMFTYLPIVGFTLRSTSIRNAFEGYGPLLRLAKLLLGDSTRLLLSSEWEYSPFVYREIKELPDFVLIGLPAPESENPLLLSLAGHEMGHSLWEKENLSQVMRNIIEEKIVNIILTDRWDEFHDIWKTIKKKDVGVNLVVTRPIWDPVNQWARRQLEEVFCDFVGLRIFAEAYLNAFNYLLAPASFGSRSPLYPNTLDRIGFMIQASNSFKIDIPSNYKSNFEDSQEPSPTEKEKVFLLSVADETCATLIDELIDKVKDICRERKIPKRVKYKVKELEKGFNQIVPPMEAGSLTNIINAGWKCYLNPRFCKRDENIDEANRHLILQELVLKSFEVYEIEELLKDKNDSKV